MWCKENESITNITVDAYGAGGGTSTQGNFIGGAGARIKGDYAVTPGQIYNILVGGSQLNHLLE